MTNTSLPAEAIYWQELGDSRVLFIWKLHRYTYCCASIVHCDINTVNLAIRSCNANNLISKFSAGLENKKKRKRLQSLTAWRSAFLIVAPQKQQKKALFLLAISPDHLASLIKTQCMKRNSVQAYERCDVSTLCVIPVLAGGKQLRKGKGSEINKPRGTRILRFYMEPVRRCWVKARMDLE